MSECVVRAALRDLASDRLVAGKPRRGHVVLAVPQERRQMLVLDIETANLGSFCSRISIKRRSFIVILSPLTLQA